MMSIIGLLFFACLIYWAWTTPRSRLSFVNQDEEQPTPFWLKGLQYLGLIALGFLLWAVYITFKYA
ncbi:hypothetical protein [Alysiella crassa]|uniref:Uncharacterized protein n=1 Tax=Alysiella crassa TaxID=153491 RepID=A0A376BUF1_9NEIS|nr:hypothetical protein [Alysiella crassa]UOP06159.1 hypothetical protein LVJ80_10025 [Alysiella crassa]SSY80632.1 Uncharacterised protein [Alysiella crassa]